MQVGDLVRFLPQLENGYQHDEEWLGIITKMWGTEACPMYEVYWSEEDSVGLYFYDDLEAVCK